MTVDVVVISSLLIDPAVVALTDGNHPTCLVVSTAGSQSARNSE